MRITHRRTLVLAAVAACALAAPTAVGASDRPVAGSAPFACDLPKS
jgi:hypothetical protein